MALVCSVLLQAKVLYLNPGPNWEEANAKFAIYYFNSSSDDGWTGYLTKTDKVYQGEVPDKYAKAIFVRLNPSGGINWESKWNQTEDLTIPADKDMYVLTNWTDGYWAKYGESGGGDNPGGTTPAEYSTAVPSQCTDVMLQAFYWNSDKDNTYGTSKWTALQAQASEISQYFQLVWLPPSCYSQTASMGYLPKQYSKQKNSMGTEDELRALIGELHKGKTKVVADVVINHASNLSGWINFFEMDFGEYGKFKPESSWITANDEAGNEEGGKYKSSLGHNNDDGQEPNANYGSARDWDHKNTDVQKMCRAYLLYLKNTIGYDGFRFDYCGGFHVSHVNDYVSNAKPYFSVMEYWNGNPGVLKARIDDAGKNTMTFDFASFYTCYQQGLAKNIYGNLINPGLRGQGYGKYAVNFIDNHDTFNRSDIGNTDCSNSSNGSSINNKDLIMQSNAYMLSMPGIPCVFWPHWYKYKSEIQKMITARRMAGVHSESSVQESSGGDYYEATVTGKYGKLIVYLGSAANKAKPEGFTEAIKINKVAIYYTGDGPKDEPDQEGINDVQNGKAQCTKVLRDGQLYIMYNGTMYNVQGNKVN